MNKNKGFTPFRNQGKNRRFLTGFTLIEILIATGILVLVGVGVIVVEKQFMGAGSAGKHKLQATALAQQGINQVKAKFNAKLLADVPEAETMKIAEGDVVPDADPIQYYLDGNALKKCTTCNLETAGAWRVEQNGVMFLRTITFPVTP